MKLKIAFQGERGAYSEEAAIQFFGQEVEFITCRDITSVFNLVEAGGADYGVVPLENSIEGSINETYDLLLSTSLKVSGEVNLKVTHCLIAHPEADPIKIKKVISHPQALAQCRIYLLSKRFEVVPSYDTAGSVRKIFEEKLLDTAAIASERAAQIYGMKILDRQIEDYGRNYTRFLVIGERDAEPTGEDKTSIIFSLPHIPGSLYRALEEFAIREINLTKIESRPTKHRPFEYYFYIDFEGHRRNPIIQEALDSLSKKTLFLKVLGSYPRAKIQ
ncbi:MAG: prephenate dehydratase [Aigarchaeota archaeon]|nr:prephenate dehydratase [Aigarchaeota archaeon]MCX8192474.1 prephenate dehydratase [Nitrososphaeria archaeon]MDW7985790.1 prephenate dehydratase [Nitrososphaerota archaeon]